ncbi:prolyl aminopeptidase [Vibrio japonicus]|uniref:Proline iminopeptidase n=1 Tax=Vibrio japonicus TaxID=1824638 RepID=A0ABY5LC35_9VIBR|nr:prolyl aminopeptidase [Vibrio japonicus]UUM29564.1 prolyl aminopeptidase [Vibrio japonicus]
MVIEAQRELYPEIEPYQSFMLPMKAAQGEQCHHIYVEQCGNPDGIPVLFLHGGPGSGCRPSHRRLFDPSNYRIILFDQRGCGRSKPYGSIKDNTSAHLVADMEQIRQHLKIEKWILFGGSWGATLGLIYAQKHAERIAGLVLRGVFLGRKQDIDWVYGHSGAAKLFPFQWATLMSLLTSEEQSSPIESIYRHLNGQDEPLKLKLKQALDVWENQLVTLTPQPTAESPDFEQLAANESKRIQLHYCIHDCFIDQPLLSRPFALTDVPCHIIQGQYDMVCPLEQGWQLYQANPEFNFKVVPLSGHVASEPLIQDALLNLMDNLACLENKKPTHATSPKTNDCVDQPSAQGVKPLQRF